MTSDKQTLSYLQSGVNIDAGNTLVERIKPIVKSTIRTGVLEGLGGFGALFELPVEKYKKPVLVSGTDGVGTKLKLANLMHKHDTIGIDLVAMCVNDIVVCGAEPLYFLDYFSTSKLDLDQAELVISGIAKGCKLAGCTLSGGETAEMPGMYQAGDYDLAGFAVGVVEKEAIINGNSVQPGDCLIGLAASGPHSNGYSLIRKVLDLSGDKLDAPFNDTTLGKALLQPTRIYVKPVLSLIEGHGVKAISHITGGGILENLPRVLPENVSALVHLPAISNLPIFQWLQETGNIPNDEMRRTFNCGVGMIICVPESERHHAIRHLNALGEQAFDLGEITNRQTQPVIFES